MAKTFTATWLGDGDPQSQIVTEGGLRFIKGEKVKVPEDLAFNGLPWANLIRNNPTFAIDSEEADLDEASEDEEAEGIKAELDKLSVRYRANASVESLRALLAKSQPPAPAPDTLP